MFLKLTLFFSEKVINKIFCFIMFFGNLMMYAVSLIATLLEPVTFLHLLEV
jgi:hypothetical protein